MSTQHTPGPWELSEGDTSLWAKSPLGARVRISNIIKHAPINGINHAANARLIAAAPDLLAALEDLLENLDETGLGTMPGDVFSNMRDTVERAKEAITKATQES